MENDRYRDNDIAAVLTAPSGQAVALAAGLLAATTLCWVAPAYFGGTWLILLTPPIYLGMIVGLFSLHRPIFNALAVLWLLMVAASLLTLFQGMLIFTILALLATPLTILGAACGGTLRRAANARRAGRALELCVRPR